MPKVKLTAVAVDRLKPPASGQIDYFDAAYPGLALRVTAKGVKSWTYFGRVHGRLRRVTLGRWPDLTLAKAREKAGEASDAMRGGGDPTAEKRRAKASPRDRDDVVAVIADWLARDQAGNRSKGEVARVMRRDVLPQWKGRRIADISRRDCIELIDAIADRGAVAMARRAHAHLHRLFRWCVGRGVVEQNPMTDLPKPGQAVKRDRALSDAELVAVWKASEGLGYPFGPLVLLLILTGTRRGEIAGLRWSEVDGETIRLAGRRTKNGEPRDIPLTPAARLLLIGLPRIGDKASKTALCFTMTGETPVSGWSKSKAAIDAKVIEALGEAIPAWHLHDLRRTVATGMQKLGCRLEVVEVVLGHIGGSRAGVVGVYQTHRFAEEQRDALRAWSFTLGKLIAGDPRAWERGRLLLLRLAERRDRRGWTRGRRRRRAPVSGNVVELGKARA